MTQPYYILDDLYRYIEKYWDHIPPYALRAELGLRNSSNRVEKANDLVVAQRQKHNGMSWSNAGSGALAQITAFIINDELGSWLNERRRFYCCLISNRSGRKLFEQNIQLITRLKSNMKNKLVDFSERLLLRKRAVIESVNDFLKNICQIEHLRYRLVDNFFVNLLAALVAYSFIPKKPSLNIPIPKLPASV